jgi:hypothetical protein
MQLTQLLMCCILLDSPVYRHREPIGHPIRRQRHRQLSIGQFDAEPKRHDDIQGNDDEHPPDRTDKCARRRGRSARSTQPGSDCAWGSVWARRRLHLRWQWAEESVWDGGGDRCRRRWGSGTVVVVSRFCESWHSVVRSSLSLAFFFILGIELVAQLDVSWPTPPLLHVTHHQSSGPTITFIIILFTHGQSWTLC